METRYVVLCKDTECGWMPRFGTEISLLYLDFYIESYWMVRLALGWVCTILCNVTILWLLRMWDPISYFLEGNSFSP